MSNLAIVGSSFLDEKATSFNGVDQYAYCDNPSFKGDTQGAFLFRYRPTTVLSSQGARAILGMGVRSALNNSIFLLIHRWNNSLAISTPYRSNPIPDISCRSVNAGAVSSGYGNHIYSAATWISQITQSDGTAYKHYIEGADVGGIGWQQDGNTGDWLGDVSGSDHRLVIGAQFISNGVQNFSDHRHNEMLYVNRPLTSGEAMEWHNGGTPRNPHGLSFIDDIVSWWRMGDSRDDGTTIYDEIGSNDLTLVNMTVSNYVNV